MSGVTDAVTVRRATPDDAEQIAGISVRAWIHAYESFLDPRVLAERTVASQAERWREWLAGDVSETQVAEVGENLQGSPRDLANSEEGEMRRRVANCLGAPIRERGYSVAQQLTLASENIFVRVRHQRLMTRP